MAHFSILKYPLIFQICSIVAALSVQDQLDHIIQTRRQMADYKGGGVILDAPTSPEHLPEAEPILPGHTLIRPALTMLKSAVKFPHKEYQDGAGVYGSLNNLGITYDSTNERLMYSGFRRMPYMGLISLKIPTELPVKGQDIHIKESKPTKSAIIGRRINLPYLDSSYITNDQNSAYGVDSLEDLSERNAPWNGLNVKNVDLRRKSKKKKKNDKNKDDSEEHSSSLLDEPNPGNPYTVHENKYLQNYLWNLEMTGDHMNVNPHAPEWQEPIPQSDLFTVRKWWYFNQDDYRPFRR